MSRELETRINRLERALYNLTTASRDRQEVLERRLATLEQRLAAQDGRPPADKLPANYRP